MDIASAIYKETKEVKDYYLRDQINRAALSISNNISEGFEYGNAADFNRFLTIAKGSCGEVRNILIFFERNHILSNSNSIIDYKRQCFELGKQIGSMKTYLVKYKANSKNYVKEEAALYNDTPLELYSMLAEAENEIFNEPVTRNS